jgi:hypothetical protein
MLMHMRGSAVMAMVNAGRMQCRVRVIGIFKVRLVATTNAAHGCCLRWDRQKARSSFLKKEPKNFYY